MCIRDRCISRVHDVKNVIFSQGQARHDVYVTYRDQLLQASISPCASRCASRWSSLRASGRVCFIKYCCTQWCTAKYPPPVYGSPRGRVAFTMLETIIVGDARVCFVFRTRRIDSTKCWYLIPINLHRHFSLTSILWYVCTNKQLNMASTVGEYTAVHWNTLLCCYIL